MSDTRMPIRFVLNGAPVTAQAEGYETLLEVIREQFHLHGARESCGQGLCGCCTVEVDGEAVTGCLYPAMHADGRTVRTIEASSTDDGRLDPVQQAFVDCGAFQCGFCTSGFVMMSRQLLARNPDPSAHDVRNYLSGNLCRCGTYPEVVDAVLLAARRLHGTTEEKA